MLENYEVRQRRRITLFVCSSCAACNPAVPLVQAWVTDHPGLVLEIARVFQQPEQIVRLGITCAPAVAVDGELVAQNAPAETLIDRLQAYLEAQGTSS
ncbi:MAG: thioredoxin family protein [Ardenticatenaceae bacterium]|nr:thioredoxin family protein [Ardenticatenaceae bacterium]